MDDLLSSFSHHFLKQCKFHLGRSWRWLTIHTICIGWLFYGQFPYLPLPWAQKLLIRNCCRWSSVHPMTGILLSQILLTQYGSICNMARWFHSTGLNLANWQGAQCQIQCCQGAAVPDSYSWSFCKQLLLPFENLHNYILVKTISYLTWVLSLLVFHLLFVLDGKSSCHAGGGKDDPTVFGWA